MYETWISSCLLFQIFLALSDILPKKDIIHGQILFGVVKCGLGFLEAFEEAFDLPQLDVILPIFSV
jgi:hypothetical protein